jgi:serine protease Do
MRTVPHSPSLALLAVVLAVALQGCAMGWRGVPDFPGLARRYGPAVVNIGVAREAAAPAQRIPAGARPPDKVDESSLGSGFIVSADGYILTNAHVVAHGRQIIVKLTDRREFKARLVGLDAVADLALLKVEATALPTVKIGDPAETQVGDWALAIGSPYGFSNSATAGIVSAKGRALPDADYMPFLQTDVPINPGNSGGPLFNARGEVIGINSRFYSSSGGYQGLSFAIPIDVAMRIKAQLQEKGTVTRGRIGVVVQEVSQALGDSFHLPQPRGALVSYVEPGGAADRAGLKPGDVVLKVDGHDVIQSADALMHIADLAPGRTVRLAIWRERAAMSLDVTIDRFDTPQVTAPAQPDRAAPLGLSLRPLLLPERQALRIDMGLLVEQVNTAASRAGVKVGDVILAINGAPVGSIEALADELRQADGAGTVALLLQRGAMRLFIPLAMPTAAGDEADNRRERTP